MHLTSTLLLIASIVCTAECSQKEVRKSSKRRVFHERTKANGLVRYLSKQKSSDSIKRKEQILIDHAVAAYTLNTKHKEQDKCIVSITDSPTGGLTAVSELCHLFGIPEGASLEFERYYMKEVYEISKDLTRMSTPNTIRLHDPGSAISSVFRVMLAHSVLDYEHHQPIELTPEFLTKYAKYTYLIDALTKTNEFRPQIKFGQNTAKIAARILENGFAYSVGKNMPNGKAPIISGMTDFQVASLRYMAIKADEETIYDEMGALDALLQVFKNHDVRRLLSVEPTALLRTNQDIHRLLNEDPRGIALLEKIHSLDEDGRFSEVLITNIWSNLITLFCTSSDDLGDRLWRFMANIGTYDDLLRIAVSVVLNHYPVIISLQTVEEMVEYIKYIDREFPIINAEIELALVRGANAKRELADMREAQSNPIHQRIRGNLESIFKLN